MDAVDRMLDSQDAADYAIGQNYGWTKASHGEAFLNRHDNVVLANERDEYGVANRLADAAEADGVRAYWREQQMAV